jgi:phospholipase/lecithinase/hemolysin
MRRWLFFLLLLPIVVFAQNRSLPFNEMIFFGDSLTDTGNLYRYLQHLLPKSPPYFKGHFSDGHVWAESIYDEFFPGADDFDDINYAVGGAGAVLDLDAVLPYTLSTEVTEYLVEHPFKRKSKTLYVIWIGGNNYLKAPDDVDKITTRVTKGIAHQIERLISAGGRMFVIPNLPNLKTTPWATSHGTSAQLEKLSLEHNRKLSLAIDGLAQQYPHLIFKYFDVAKIYDEYYRYPEKVGIKYVNEPCLKDGGVLGETAYELRQANWLQQQASQSGISLSDEFVKAILDNPELSVTVSASMVANLGGEVPANCDDYLFFDPVHPTHKVHTLLAEFIRKEIPGA